MMRHAEDACGTSLASRRRHWESVAAELNALGPAKTLDKWKKCWRSLKSSTSMENTVRDRPREITEKDHLILSLGGDMAAGTEVANNVLGNTMFHSKFEIPANAAQPNNVIS